MKFQKAVSLAVFLAMAMLFFASPAQAIPLKEAQISCADVVITPLWVNTDVARATISVSNLVLKPSAYIKAKSTSTGISGTLYLERKSGSNWIMRILRPLMNSTLLLLRTRKENFFRN